MAGERSVSVGPLVVRAGHGIESITALLPAIDKLAAEALEANPSCEAWMLVPSLRHLCADGAVRIVTVHEEAPDAGDEGLLRGVFLAEFRTRSRLPPVNRLRLWEHGYSLSSAPLLHRDFARETLRAFFRWAAEELPRGTLIEFPALRADGAAFIELARFLRDDDLTHVISDTHARALFRPAAAADAFLQSVGSRHAQREWQRCERRLAEMGELRYELLESGAETGEWVDEFVALEMSGWKGRAGTAFGCNPSHRAWLSEVVLAAQRRRQLMALALRLDGKPIAMKLNFVCPPGGYTFKIAFDESFAKYTPGTLLELENVRRLHERRDIEWMDSMALPDHPMINRLWPDRATFVTVLVAPRRLFAEMALASRGLLHLARRWLRPAPKPAAEETGTP